VRYLGRATVAVSVCAFVSTVAFAVLFLLVFKRVYEPPIFVDYGLALGCVPLALIAATYLLRLGAARWMLEAGCLDEAYEYSHSRRKGGVTVGRTEAAVNRYVAAEAVRRMGRPEEALRILDEDYRAPRRRAILVLLERARAHSLSDLG
jgi:hypothetical protein